MARSRGDTLVVAGAAASAARMLRKDFRSRVMVKVASVSLRRGMRSGRHGWLYLAAAATGMRMFQKYLGRKEEVMSIRLQPGESLSIREIVPTK